LSAFKIDASDLIDGLTGLEARTLVATKVYAQTAANNLESYAKQNAPWTDRTGMARKSIAGSISDIPHGVRITLAHGVDYGIWLELAHEKKFATIAPTIRVKSASVVKGFENLMNKAGYTVGS
jgi:hypothetical protein